MIIRTLAAIGGFVVSVQQRLLNEALQHYIPDIKKAFTSITLPSNSSNGVTHNEITLSNNDFSDASISLLNGAGAKLDVSKISFKIERSDFSVNKYGITCKGHIWGSLTGLNASGIASLLISNGAVKAMVDTNLAWGKLTFHHKLTNSACRFVEDIVELFIGDINKKIEDAVKSTVPDRVKQVFQKMLDEALSTFGTQVELPHDVLFDYTALDLRTTNDIAIFEVLGQFKDKNNPEKPTPYTPNAMKGQFPYHEANVMMSEFPVNTAFEIYTAKGLLAYHVEIPHSIFNPGTIPGIHCAADCKAVADFWVTSPPKATFNGAPHYNDLVQLQGAYVNLSYTSSRGSGPIFTVEIDALLIAMFNISKINGKDVVTATMDQSTIDYSIVKSSVGFFDTMLERAVIAFAVREFCFLFNKLFPGIPLPVDLGEGVTLSTVKTYQSLQTVDVGVDVLFSKLKTSRKDKYESG